MLHRVEGWSYPSRVTSPTEIPGTAGWLRRILALAIDWVACLGVTYAILGTTSSGGASFFPLLVLLVEVTAGTTLLGGSFGQLLTRLRVRYVVGPRAGQQLTPWHALIRTVLICLAVPPLIYRPDGRGLHDLAVGSATFPLVPAR